ncbi:glycosyltransferase family 4 protein [Neobacillus soli]|uniref:glycosyltransferase family 4 protein n=1 Tax=Neobacillus soli TaxID=220688 RepID=UPI000825F2EA|nr:glycosyltransferase family 4 protein [Neobacillus soli]
MKKKKILYVHHGQSEGGAPRSLAFLIQKLDKEKYKPIVLCMYDENNIKLFESVGAKVILDKKMRPFHGSTVSGMDLDIFVRNIIGAYPTYFKIKHYIKKIKPDLIHLNSSSLFMGAKAAKKVLPFVPVIVHIREPLLKNIFGEILRKMNQKYADAYVAIDQNDLDSMKPNNKNCKVIYNFVDFNVYNPTIASNILRKELNIKNDQIIFLYLARIARSNGTFELIEEAVKVTKDHPNYFFVIVGDDSNDKSTYTERVRKLAKLSENIRIIPFRDDIPNVISSADVMVCPFIEPHFSRAIIEGASMGIPSIGSNIGGVNELIKPGITGELFDYTNFADFTNKCLNLGEDLELRQYMGKNAYDFAKEKFDSVKNAEETFSLYEELLRNKNEN